MNFSAFWTQTSAFWGTRFHDYWLGLRNRVVTQNMKHLHKCVFISNKYNPIVQCRHTWANYSSSADTMSWISVVSSPYISTLNDLSICAVGSNCLQHMPRHIRLVCRIIIALNMSILRRFLTFVFTIVTLLLILAAGPQEWAGLDSGAAWLDDDIPKFNDFY